MGRSQWIAAGVAALLVVITYAACPVQSPVGGATLPQAPTATTGLESLIRAARDELSPAQIATLATLEDQLKAAEATDDDDARLTALKQLAGEWYRAGQPAISGVYATSIAEQENNSLAWSIAGTTFSLCLKQEDTEDRTRQFCADRAEAAYQAAISLEPGNLDHRLNLAVTYTDLPPRDNPMKGVLQLRQLVEDFPDSARVYLTLAQLAIRTNQLERAAERLETAVSLAPNNPDAVCNLARVYDQLERTAEAAPLRERCSALVQ